MTLADVQAKLREMALRPFFHVDQIRELQRELGALADAMETDLDLTEQIYNEPYHPSERE